MERACLGKSKARLSQRLGRMAHAQDLRLSIEEGGLLGEVAGQGPSYCRGFLLAVTGRDNFRAIKSSSLRLRWSIRLISL